MTNPTGKSPADKDPKEPSPTLRDQVTEKGAALVMGNPPTTEPPPPPPPDTPVDPAKAAKTRRELLELDAHDIRREGAYVQQAQGSGPVHYMPPNATSVFPSDAVLAAEGMLQPDKADAFLTDEKKFQRPGFVEGLEKRMQQETTDRKAAIQAQIDQLQQELKNLNGNGGSSKSSEESTADKIHASKK